MTTCSNHPIFWFLLSLMLEVHCTYKIGNTGQPEYFQMGHGTFRGQSGGLTNNDRLQTLRHNVLPTTGDTGDSAIEQVHDKRVTIKNMLSDYNDFSASGKFVPSMQNKLNSDRNTFNPTEDEDIMLHAHAERPTIPSRRRRAFKTDVINRIAHGFGKRNRWRMDSVPQELDDVNDVDDVDKDVMSMEEDPRVFKHLLNGYLYDRRLDSIDNDLEPKPFKLIYMLKTYLHSGASALGNRVIEDETLQ